MDVFECAVCKLPIGEQPKGVAAVYSADGTRRRPLWGPAMVLEA